MKELQKATIQPRPIKDSVATTETKDKVESRLLLNVIVRKSASVLELLSSEDEALLVRRDALLVLDLALDVVDRVRVLDLERDGLAGDWRLER